jgi:hypothetical protein
MVDQLRPEITPNCERKTFLVPKKIPTHGDFLCCSFNNLLGYFFPSINSRLSHVHALLLLENAGFFYFITAVN